MSNWLNIANKPIFDDSVSKYEIHNYAPFNENYDNNDTITISIQQQNLNVLPSESFLYIEGNIVSAGDVKLVNNSACFLFEEIRYELNGVEIDKTRKVGFSSTLKNFISLNSSENLMLKNASWSLNGIDITNGEFNFCIPLKNVLGFCEDYKKIILNAKHDLILTRAKTDSNFYIAVENEAANVKVVQKIAVDLRKVQWRMPHVTVSNEEKLALYKTINKGDSINLTFRSWDMHIYPSLPKATQHIWTVKTSTQLEKPRFIVFALQTNRDDAPLKNPSKFDHCELRNVKVFLNSTSYPYEPLNLKFATDRYSVLYQMYANFQRSYYGRENSPILSPNDFKEYGPIVVIDCLHQDEIIKTGPIDLKIEFETESNVPEKTTAYCLLLHDKIIDYNMFTNEVRKI